MVITCPTCGHQGKVDPSKIPAQGAKAKCPSCQNGFHIQRPAEQPGQPPAAPPDPSQPASPPPAQSPQAPSQQPPQPAPTRPTPPASGQPPEAAAAGASPGPAGGDSQAAPDPAGGLSLQAPPPQTAASKDVACTGCLKLFKEEEVANIGDRNLCQSCQEAFQNKGQKPSSPSSVPSYGLPAKKRRMDYGGFWIRVVAYIIDGFVLGLIFWFIVTPIFMKMFSNMFASVPMMDPSTMTEAQMQAMFADAAGRMMKTVWITQLINLVITGGYFILLEGGPGQTLGKKALGLRVVTPEGDRIGFLKAFARYIGKIISGIILCIGFIMAAFDSEKRALHDRMCNTRVIKV